MFFGGFDAWKPSSSGGIEKLKFDTCHPTKHLKMGGDISDPLVPQHEASLAQRVRVEITNMSKIAGPALFSRLALFSMTLVTQAFAGHLTNIDLAAVSISTTVILTISFGFLLGMASALQTLCGQAYGAKQYPMMGIYLQRSWLLLFLCSVLLLPLYLFATPILKLTGQTNEVADKSGIAALWMIPLHFSFAFQFPLQRFLQCQVKTFVIVWVSGGAFVIHVIISWFFNSKLGVGLVGNVIILDVSWWISVFGLYGYTVCGGCPDTWRGFSIQAFSGLWEFLKLSAASGIMLWYIFFLPFSSVNEYWPLSCFTVTRKPQFELSNTVFPICYETSLENWYYRILIIVAGYLSTSEVALDALSICMAIYGLVSMITLGFFAASGVRVANELGAGNIKAANFAAIVSTVVSLVVSLIFCGLILIFPNHIGHFFTASPLIVTFVNRLSVLLALTVLFNSIQPVLSGVAVGSGWQESVAYVNIASYYIVGVPLGLLMGWVFQLGIEGIWAGMLSGTLVQTLLLAVITIKFDRRNKDECL